MLPHFENTLATDPSLAYGLVLAGLLADHILVACRLLGLLVTIPGFNSAALPWHLKCVLLIVTAAVITPNVSLAAKPALQPRETAQQFADVGVQPVSHVAVAPLDGVRIDSQSSASTIMRSRSRLNSCAEFLGLAVCEVCLGLMLGVGANLVLQGFRMAGQLIDQQTGWGLIPAASLDGEDTGTITGELLFWMGTVLLFVLGGHLLLISALLGTFQTFPPGCGSLPGELIPLLSQLVQHSLSLALQLSAPVLATQILAGLILSYAETMGPQFQHAGTGTIVRLVFAMTVLSLTLSGLADQLIELIPASLQLWSTSMQSQNG